MTRLFIFALFSMIHFIASSQIFEETVYYDENGNGVASVELATYIATFIYPDDPNYEKQYIIKRIQDGSVFIKGTFYRANKYKMSEIVSKDKWIYYANGNLKSEQIGDSLTFIYKLYFESGKLKHQANYINGNVHGKSYGFNEKTNAYAISYYDCGVPRDTFDYYYNGMHSQYLLSNKQAVPSSVSIEDRQLIKNKSGEQWYKYSKNGLIVQARAVESKEYGKFWTIQLAISNYSRNYINIKVANMHGLGIKKDKVFDLKFIPADVYFKKVVKKQNRRMFAARLFGAVADNMSATSHSYTSGRVGKTTYNAHTSYFDSYAYERASERTNARLKEYNDALLDEREELAENYITDCAVNPGESIVGFVNYEHKSIDHLGFILVIDGIEYEYRWHTN